MHAAAFTYTKNPFILAFKAASREPLAWGEEVRAIALSLAKSAGNRPIIVCASGGIDSELICRALFEQGIHFSVLTVEHAAGTNQTDIAFARKWCREHGIEQRIVKLDMPDFFSHTIERYVDEGYIAGNVYRYFQIFLLERVEEFGGYGVIGSGEQVYNIENTADPSAEDVYLRYESGVVAPIDWMLKNRVTHCPYFYYRTPEVCLAYLRIPIVDFALRNPAVFRHPVNKYVFKRFVLQSLWPDLQARPKMSGYEAIQDLRTEKQNTLRARFGDALKPYHLGIPLFRRQLEGETMVVQPRSTT